MLDLLQKNGNTSEYVTHKDFKAELQKLIKLLQQAVKKNESISSKVIQKIIDRATPSDDEMRAIMKPLIPEPKNGKDYVLTKEDKEQIAKLSTSMVKNSDPSELISSTDIINMIKGHKGKDRLIVDNIKGFKKYINRLNDLTGAYSNLFDSVNQGNEDLLFIKKKIDAITIDIAQNKKADVAGANTFLQLTDTPSTYTGSIGKGVRVNATGTGLEFYTISSGATDEKVGVSANDTTPGYLNGKLVAGSLVTLNEINDGGNETLKVDVEVEMNDLTDVDTTGLLTDDILKFDGTNWVPYSSWQGAFEKVGTTIKERGLVGTSANDFVVNADSVYNTTSANRLSFDSSKGAFRAGLYTNFNWNNPNVGVQSIAFGQFSTASGVGAYAQGSGNNAAGDYSISTGNGSQAFGDESIAHGRNGVIASNLLSRAYGSSSSAFADYAVADGEGAAANGAYSFANSYFNTANGLKSLSLAGEFNTANGAESITVGGNRNNASGTSSSVVGGDHNTASGNDSGVFGGNYGTASGVNAAIAGGTINIASGISSFVGGGWDNTATQQYTAIVGGYRNDASGNYASVFGSLDSNASGSGSSVVSSNNSDSTNVRSLVLGGEQNTASGVLATVISGSLNTSASFTETVMGPFADLIAATSASAHDPADHSLRVGIGPNTGARADGFRVRKDGALYAGSLPVYANDAAAGLGGLTQGYIYQTATGELRIKL